MYKTGKGIAEKVWELYQIPHLQRRVALKEVAALIDHDLAKENADTARLDALEAMAFTNREGEQELHFDFKGTLREAIDVATGAEETKCLK